MSEADRKKGVVGWSSGNHAQGLAEAARLMGMKATIVMPADAPALKIANTKASGAEVVLHDRVKDSREEIGMGIAKKTGATVVPPYDHPWILTGQGTAGLEIVEQAKALGVTLDAVAAPCSGGGLSTGIALAVKGLSPGTSVHAGEPAGFDDLARSLAAGTKQKNDKLSGSICDALLAPTPGDVTFPLAKQLLGPGLVVTDDEVLDAMETAFREFKLVVEPGGAVALAAALTGKLPVKGRAVAVVCSGRQCRPRDLRARSRAVAPHELSTRSRPAGMAIFFWLSLGMRRAQRLLRLHHAPVEAAAACRRWSAIVSSLIIATPILLLRGQGARARRSCGACGGCRCVLYFAIRSSSTSSSSSAAWCWRACCSGRSGHRRFDAMIFEGSIAFAVAMSVLGQPRRSRWAACWASARSGTC